MGNLFKVLAATSPGLATPYPFGTLMIQPTRLSHPRALAMVSSPVRGAIRPASSLAQLRLGSGDDRETVRATAPWWRRRWHRGPDLFTAYQVHSPDAIVVTAPWDT